MTSVEQDDPIGIDGEITCFQNASVKCILIYLQLFVTEDNDNNDHSQTQDYCSHDVQDFHDIMIQQNNQNADPQDYQNHALSGIGTFTQSRLCDMYSFIIMLQKEV